MIHHPLESALAARLRAERHAMQVGRIERRLSTRGMVALLCLLWWLITVVLLGLLYFWASAPRTSPAAGDAQRHGEQQWALPARSERIEG